MIALVRLQVRLAAQRPRDWLLVLPMAVLLFTAEGKFWEALLPFGLVQVGLAARGVDLTDPAGRLPMPTLPFSPRQRAVASVLAAALLTTPGLLLGGLVHTWRSGSALEGVVGAVAVAGWIAPFLVVGAAAPMATTVSWMVVSVPVAVAAHASSLVLDPIGAVAWGVAGSAVILRYGPQLEGAPARPGSELVARARGPAAWITASQSPLRTWWRLQSVGWRGGLLLLVIGTTVSAAAVAGVPFVRLDALAVGPLAWLAALVPAWPTFSGRSAVAILRRLPVHPRAAFRSGVWSSLLPLTLALVVPMIVVSGSALDRPDGGLLLAVFIAVCGTLLVRAGGVSRGFLRDRLPADACLAAGLLSFATALALQTLAPGFTQLPLALTACVGVATVAMLVWADRSAGLPRQGTSGE